MSAVTPGWVVAACVYRIRPRSQSALSGRPGRYGPRPPRRYPPAALVLAHAGVARQQSLTRCAGLDEGQLDVEVRPRRRLYTAGAGAIDRAEHDRFRCPALLLRHRLEGNARDRRRCPVHVSTRGEFPRNASSPLSSASTRSSICLYPRPRPSALRCYDRPGERPEAAAGNSARARHPAGLRAEHEVRVNPRGDRVDQASISLCPKLRTACRTTAPAAAAGFPPGPPGASHIGVADGLPVVVRGIQAMSSAGT